MTPSPFSSEVTQTVAQTNGVSVELLVELPQTWLRQTVQQFFNGVNWEGHPPEIQQLRQSVQTVNGTLGLLLTVNQFFSAFNWEGDAATPSVPMLSVPAASEDAFTLEKFSDLF